MMGKIDDKRTVTITFTDDDDMNFELTEPHIEDLRRIVTGVEKLIELFESPELKSYFEDDDDEEEG